MQVGPLGITKVVQRCMINPFNFATSDLANDQKLHRQAWMVD